MFGVADEVDIHIGTLSKGFGSHGGFVAGSSILKSFLMNKGRSYVFSTALPLPAVAAAEAAIHVCRQVWLKPVHALWTVCTPDLVSISVPKLVFSFDELLCFCPLLQNAPLWHCS